ncbi:TPA: hypothetical protein ACPVKL_001396 [Escherichia coli]|nr:hypothetical protein [Escherichia coli]HCO1619604.1 hypothetical protein [Escherichia coli]HCP6531521.1 hypothetical protein [Escherichia coli]
MIFSDKDKGRRGRLADGYSSLQNKQFCDYTDEDMRKIGIIDVALELHSNDFQGSQLGMLDLADRVNNHEVAIIDNCLCIRRIAPPLPGMIHNKKVLTDPAFAYMWVGYIKVIAVHSLSYKDSFRAGDRWRYFSMLQDNEKRLNADLPVGGYEATDLQGIVLANLFSRPDYSDDAHADCPQFVPDDYVAVPPEQVE